MSTRQVAVVGCGHWGRSLVRNFGKIGALAAAADPAEQGYERAQPMVSGERAEVELETALSDDVLGGVDRHPVVTLPARPGGVGRCASL